MELSREGRIIELCKKHNWELSSEQLQVIIKACDMEQLEAGMKAFKNTPYELYYPRRKYKEIALEQAAIFCKDSCGEEDMLCVADKIYKWLICEEQPKQ